MSNFNGNTGTNELEDGTANLFVNSVKINDISTPGLPLKVDANKEIYSTTLDISDTSGLQTALDATIQTPYVGVIQATDFKSENIPSIDISIQSLVASNASKLSKIDTADQSIVSNLTLTDNTKKITAANIETEEVTTTNGNLNITGVVSQTGAQYYIESAVTPANNFRIDMLGGSTQLQGRGGPLYVTSQADKVIVNGSELEVSAPATFNDTVSTPNVASVDASITSLNEEASTGILSGGILSVNVDDTKFDISDGGGYISDANGLLTKVLWTGLTAQTPTAPYSGILTYVFINSSGVSFTQANKPTNTQIRNNIFLGVLIHTNFINLNTVNNEQSVVAYGTNQLRDFMNAIGFLNLEGNLMSSPSGLFISKSTGVIFAQGSNYINNAKDPHTLSLAAIDTSAGGIFQYRFQDGTSSALTLTQFNPALLDDGTPYPGTGTIGANKYGAHRVYSFISNALKIQPAQFEYNTLGAAKAAIQTEGFVSEPSLSNGLLIGYIIARGGTTSLAVDTEFITAGKFGNSVNSIASSVSTLQNAYDNSTTPEILTSANRALTVQEGVLDTNNTLEVRNLAGTVTTSIKGGAIQSTSPVTGSIQTYGGLGVVGEIHNGDGITTDGDVVCGGDLDVIGTYKSNGKLGILPNTGVPGITGNLFCGTNAGITVITNGINNTSFGGLNFQAITSGQRNSAFGYNALRFVDVGRGNTAMGQFAIPILTNGEFNTGVGNNCLTLLTEGDNNTAFGLNAGASLTEGNNNTMIGSETDCSALLNNQIAIGYQATTTVADQCIIGNSSLAHVLSDGFRDLDTINNNVLAIGTSNASSVSIGKIGAITEVNGDLNLGGDVNLTDGIRIGNASSDYNGIKSSGKVNGSLPDPNLFADEQQMMRWSSGDGTAGVQNNNIFELYSSVMLGEQANNRVIDNSVVLEVKSTAILNDTEKATVFKFLGNLDCQEAVICRKNVNITDELLVSGDIGRVTQRVPNVYADTLNGLSPTGGLFAQTATQTATGTGEQTLITTGVGSLTVPANTFKVGDSFMLKMSGEKTNSNTNTINIRLKSGSTTLASTGTITLPSLSSAPWELTSEFTVRAIGGATVASLSTGGKFVYTDVNNYEGASFSVINNTTFNTTISNTLNITADQSTAGNTTTCTNLILTKIY